MKAVWYRKDALKNKQNDRAPVMVAIPAQWPGGRLKQQGLTMAPHDWDIEQAVLIHQLDQIEMDGELRLKMQELVLRWFADQREADRRWTLREYVEAGQY